MWLIIVFRICKLTSHWPIHISRSGGLTFNWQNKKLTRQNRRELLPPAGDFLLSPSRCGTSVNYLFLVSLPDGLSLSTTPRAKKRNIVLLQCFNYSSVHNITHMARRKSFTHKTYTCRPWQFANKQSGDHRLSGDRERDGGVRSNAISWHKKTVASVTTTHYKTQTILEVA